MSKPNADPDTYLFMIDSKGDISAHLDQYIAAQESYAAAICLNVDDEGMRPFFLHLDDAELQSRHPGAVRKPPIQKPARPATDAPNFSNLFKFYEEDKDTYDSYRTGVTLLISGWFDYLTPALQEKLKSADPVNMMVSVTCSHIYKELVSTHGKFLDSAKKNLQQTISGPLNLTVSLETNFTNMITANASLAAKNVGYQDHVMFDFAYEKLMANQRTEAVALRYKTRDEFDPSNPSFTHFAKWITAHYDIVKSSLSTHTAAAAFIDDPVKTPAPLPITHDNVAAATISPGRTITLTEKEYDDLIAKASSPPPRNRNNQPRPALGYCFLFGYGNHGPGFISRRTSKPTFCREMSDKDGNPRLGTIYTKEQILCKSSKGGPINGLPRSQVVQAGFTKP